MDCKNVTGTPGFDESTFTQLACDATIRTIAQQVWQLLLRIFFDMDGQIFPLFFLFLSAVYLATKKRIHNMNNSQFV